MMTLGRDRPPPRIAPLPQPTRLFCGVHVSMKVQVKKLKGLTNELVKAFPLDEEPYPHPRNKNLPDSFFLAGFAGSRGSGKTQMTVRLLKDLEESKYYDEKGKEVPQRVILVSPTSEANPQFRRLSNLDDKDIYPNYTDKLLLSLMEEIKADRLATKKYKKACILWKQFRKYIMKDRDPLLIMDKLDLQLLSGETNGFRDEPTKPAHPNGQVVQLVLDDCVSSPAFKLNRTNAFSGFCLNSRHYWTNIILCTQRLKQIQPIIRSNLTLVAIWRTMSHKLLIEEIWPVCSGILTEQQFLAYYEAAVKNCKWDCLTIDTRSPEGSQIRRNLNEVMILKS